MPGRKGPVNNPHALSVGKVVDKAQFVLQYMNWVRWNQAHEKYFRQCHRDPNILNWFMCCNRHYTYFCQLSAFKEYGRKLMPWNPWTVLSREWFQEYATKMNVKLPDDFSYIVFGSR